MVVAVPPGFWDFIQYVSEVAQESSNGAAAATAKAPKRSARMDKVPLPKQKRKVSRYQKVFGKHLKALKKKHPRTSISELMKKAHRMTRKELK